MDPAILVEQFRQHYEHTDFRDAHFTEDEYTYKLERGKQMREWLDREALRQLIEQENWAEVCRRVVQSFSMSSGPLARWDEYQWVAALDAVEQQQFVLALEAFLYGDGPFLERLGHFVAEATEAYQRFRERDPAHQKRYNAKKISWPFVSYFHFMMWPDREYVFVKPTPLGNAAQLAGFDLQYRPQANAVTYAHVQEFYRALWPAVLSLGGRDWIDVQTLIHVAGGGFDESKSDEGDEAEIDVWAERIARWLQEYLPPERLRMRQEGEARARALLESKLGQFDEADLRQFLADLSADWVNGKERTDRFMPAFYGSQINRLLDTLPAFNLWTERLWRADEDELDVLLDEFWNKLDVSGAGTSLPTALLYLRDPKRYAIWLPVMSKGLELTTGFVPGQWRTAEGYHHYNAVAGDFSARYDLPPQSLDVILWQAARTDTRNVVAGTGESVVTGNFTGFTEDTFRFLQELAANNNEEWMHGNDNDNELRYRRVLREPLRELLKTVGPEVKALDPTFETEAKFGKVLAGIKKRWPDDEGPYHTHYWGAFYRQGRTKQTDAQLFVIIHPTHINVGFSAAGAQGSDVLARFQRNLQQASEVFLALLQALPPDVKVRTAEHHGVQDKTTLVVQTSDDLQQLLQSALIDIERSYSADDPILQQPEFAAEVGALFRTLYPVYRFAVTDDPDELASLLPAVEEEIEEQELEPRLTLADVSAVTFLSLAFLEETAILLRDKKQIVFYGPPGTGKTFVARHLARYWVDAAPDTGGTVQVVQFHPSYAYEEFVEGIRPQSVEGPDGRRELSYPVKKGLFRRFCDEARGHPLRHYVLLLDEINRGELPRILGELLYLLEYRDQTVTLPYSGESFAIPPNLYFIGTMNTADRSIALVDHALRRRFHFVPLRPDPEIVRAYLESNGRPEMAWAADLLERVNRRLEQDGVEWHQHIGHSHMLRPDLDEAWLRLIWTYSILPTLEEYFYRQPETLRSYTLDALKEELEQG